MRAVYGEGAYRNSAGVIVVPPPRDIAMMQQGRFDVFDSDGAVLIPAALLDDVVAAAVEQERLEGWIMSQVDAGVPLPGLYPPNEDNKARYEAWARSRRD
jgi:hypothetical protein